MIRYIVKRLLMMIPILPGISFIVLILIDITPGDPARIILGPQKWRKIVYKNYCNAIRVFEDTRILKGEKYERRQKKSNTGGLEPERRSSFDSAGGAVGAATGRLKRLAGRICMA
jgi:ABC-type microcin C transport system permease subunit YejB